jgi:hypothetical protein
MDSKWILSKNRRDQLYAFLVLLLFVLAIGMALLKSKQLKQEFNLIVSDSRFYYAYLPSAIIDGDLDFSNQIKDTWGVDFRQELLEDKTETGLIRNKYPIGISLTLLPSFMLGHAVAVSSGGLISANGYSWPYQILCLGLIELLVWITLVRIDRILTEQLHIPAFPSFLSVIVLTFGTPYTYYICREPFMAHAISTFWCVEIAYISITHYYNSKTLARLAFCVAMAIICRPTNVHLFPIIALGLVASMRKSGVRTVISSLPWLIVALIPIGLQVFTWRTLSGNWINYSYSDEGFNWFQPALWQTLFSSRHGVFFWSPILLMATIYLFTKIRNPLIFFWSLGAILLWYANSAWHCWWFGDAFGGRAFIELSGLFTVGLAIFFASLQQKPKIAIAVASFSIIFNILFMFLYISHRISRDGYLL